MNSLKSLFLLLSLLGISILSLFYFIEEPVEISHLSYLKGLQNNQKVISYGTLMQIRENSGFIEIRLGNNLSFSCECEISRALQNKVVSVEGKFLKYPSPHLKLEKIYLKQE